MSDTCPNCATQAREIAELRTRAEDAERLLASNEGRIKEIVDDQLVKRATAAEASLAALRAQHDALCAQLQEWAAVSYEFKCWIESGPKLNADSTTRGAALLAAEARVAELEKALQAADGIALQVESMVKIGPSHDGSVERDLRRLLDVYRGMRSALAKPAHDALAKHPSPNQDILPTDPYGGT